jgi:hypothetical protein
VVISLWLRDKSTIKRSGGLAVHLAPKNYECRNLLEKFSLRLFGIKTASSTLIIFETGKLSTRCITHLRQCNLRTFWWKRRGNFTNGVLCLHNAPGHRELATQKKLACLGFQCFDNPPYSPDLAPSDYRVFSGLKKQLKSHHCCRGVLVGLTTIWIFLSGLHKLEQRAKKRIELRWEYVE